MIIAAAVLVSLPLWLIVLELIDLNKNNRNVRENNKE